MRMNLAYKDIKYAVAYALGKINAGRNVTVLPDDIFIVSYPKSGNTWVRFLVGNILYGEEKDVNFLNIEKLVPDIYQHTDATLLKCNSPRVLKSHEYFDPRYKRIIFIVRDPRDIVVSKYFFLIKNRLIDDGSDLTEFVDRFMSGEISKRGNWDEYVGSWLGTKREGLCLVRYEDLQFDTKNTVNKIAKFIGKRLSEFQTEDDIRKSSFETMQSLEIIQGRKWKPIKRARQDMLFVRSGKVGQWRSIIPKTAAEKIWNAWSDRMLQLGYQKE